MGAVVLLAVVAMAATFLCSLVAGLLITFAVVVMPGLGALDDRAFIRAFQVIDRVIQRREPLFMVIWLGAAVMLLAALVLGFVQVSGFDRLLLVAAAGLHALGVQLPTFAINVPLNNRLQALDVDKLGEAECRTARRDFEPRWNYWNRVRTVLASLSALLLVLLVIRL